MAMDQQSIFDQIEDRRQGRLLRNHYAADWADRPRRQMAMEELRAASAGDFEWIVASRFPVLNLSATALEFFGESIERDFISYRNAARRIDSQVPSVVVVSGWVVARTRTSRESVRRPFTDVWGFDDAQVLRIEST